MFVALCSSALSGPAAAKDESSDGEAPIVVNGDRIDDPLPTVNATKTGTPLLDTPQSIATLSREQIDDQGFEQLNDALRYVPGVTLGQGEGHRDQVVLRGQSSTADFFLDGLRDDAQYYRPLYDTERVEVLKGANALLFGRGGGGGVINRVSKVPQFDQPRLGAAASVDSFGAWSLAADVNQPLSADAALRLNGTYEALDNHRDFFDGHFLGLAPTFGARLGERTQLTLAYEYAEDRRTTDRGVPSLDHEPIRGFDSTFFGDPAVNRSEVTAHIARARFERELAEGLSFNLTGQYAHYDKLYANIVPGAVDAAAGTVTLTGYRSGAERANWIGQANLVWKGRTGPVGHTLLAGFEAGDQDTDATRDDARFGAASSVSVALGRTIAVPPSSFVIASASRSDVRSLSAYVQDQFEFGEHIQFIAGLRYDNFRIAATNLLTGADTGRSDGKWSPRLGLVIKPQPSLSLYASYARSFLPQSGDQFTTLAANLQTLAPEAFRNLEAGIKWEPRPDLALNAAAFQVDRTNTRATDPLSGNPVLTGASRVKGFELSLAGKLAPGWQASLGYTYQEGEIRRTTTAAPAGRQLDKLPHHQISAWTRYDVSGRLGLGLGLIHQSSQYATISNDVRLPGFTRIDAAVYYDLSERLALQLNVENLTDVDYFPSAHTDNNIATGEPLNAKLTVRLKW
jgi:catecholate siderophore receptor